MRAHRASVFFSALLAILAPTDADQNIGSNMESTTRDKALSVSPADETTNSRSLGVEEISAGPDPFFDDVVDKTFIEEAKQEMDSVRTGEAIPQQTYLVEVYENESRGLDMRWRELRPGWRSAGAVLRWSYQDGSLALPPEEILPPDDWGWVSEWKIDGSRGRDVGGWEYTKALGDFSTPRAPKKAKLTDRYRRRRWIRAMRPRMAQQTQEADEADFELGDLAERTTIGAPALNVHAYDFETEDFAFDARRGMDFDLLPAPDYKERRGAATTALSIPAFGQAVTAVKGWWTEEFTFRGFGVGIVKPIFRGMLLRPDVGVGIRLPITLHFRSWERQEALPSVSSSFFVLWPPAVQASQAMSYPAELLQEWATTAVRRIAVPSKETLQARQRRKSVQRLGVTVGVRYSATYGFQWWLAPYFFLLPGVRVLWLIYQSAMTMLLSSMDLMQRSDSDKEQNKTSKDDHERALWLVALRCWAAAKTSGLGYSLHYSGNRLGGAVMVNFMPFFLPTVSLKRFVSKEEKRRDASLSNFENVDPVDTKTEELNSAKELSAQEVDIEIEHSLEMSEAEPQRSEGSVLQPCAA